MCLWGGGGGGGGVGYAVYAMHNFFSFFCMIFNVSKLCMCEVVCLYTGRCV